jgi:hypothetical protein
MQGILTGNPDGSVKFTATMPCMACGNTVAVDRLDPDAVLSWQAGALVQDVFPHLSASEREALMTGTHAECWGEMLPPEAEEVGEPPCAECGEPSEVECAACDRPLCAEHRRTTSVPGDSFCQTGQGCAQPYA